MTDFSCVKFCGEFRDYQKEILDNYERHMIDGRIHIVAAPGSGKTILGLELIRRLGNPALVLSPSVTIRGQWGERFTDNFLSPDSKSDDYISYDLKHPRLITSVTYQGLHAAMNKTISEENDFGDESDTDIVSDDFTDFDLIKTVRKYGIKTICLDEAHHLKSEWERALENFISSLGDGIKVIALTATPPYDSSAAEWKRYSDLCGEIDEEIFVPQLVAQKTLCPHQDYIYFNYPTDGENEIFKKYKQKANDCAEKIIADGIVVAALENSGVADGGNNEFMYDNAEKFISLLSVAAYGGAVIPKKIMKALCRGSIPAYKLKHAEIAFGFIIDNPDVFGKELSASLKNELAKNSLIEQKRVCLVSNDKINKMLISSVGKLKSINAIVKSESEALEDGLRMLILTDFIRGAMVASVIGTEKEITTMGAVPIFESLRREADEKVSIALLSGTLVLAPLKSADKIAAICERFGVGCDYSLLPGTEHCKINISGSNKSKVSVMTLAFGMGLFNVLVGTKALLGEGWDSPCINSLVLASFVGSFMLSNQMRGRAIRTDRENPGKVSNIWHLVTVEPPIMFLKNEAEKALYKVAGEGVMTDEIPGRDYETVERRFEGFLAPAYERKIIESGIGRLDVITPPYDSEGIERINARMLELARDREGMAGKWEAALDGNEKPEILQVNEVSPAVQPKGFLFKNILAECIYAFIIILFIRSGLYAMISSLGDIISLIIFAAFFGVIGFFMLAALIKIINFFSPLNSVRTLSACILRGLKMQGLIESRDAKIKVVKNTIGTEIYCTLTGATVYEKNIFAAAVSELLSPVEFPRYLIIREIKFFGKRIRKCSECYACPSVFGTNKENAAEFAKILSAREGKFGFVYTRTDEGRETLRKCRKRSYINRNAKFAKRKKAVMG